MKPEYCQAYFSFSKKFHEYRHYEPQIHNSQWIKSTNKENKKMNQDEQKEERPDKQPKIPYLQLDINLDWIQLDWMDDDGYGGAIGSTYYRP